MRDVFQEKMEGNKKYGRRSMICWMISKEEEIINKIWQQVENKKMENDKVAQKKVNF